MDHFIFLCSVCNDKFPKGNPFSTHVFLHFSVFFLLWISILPCLSQTRYYVSATGSATGNALSWSTACNDLQLVFNNASANDTVWVAQGTYLPIRPADSLHKVDSNNRRNTFVIDKPLCVYGGFLGIETDLSQRQLPFHGSNGLSVLSGDIGIPNNSADNAFHVLIVISTTTVYINGFIITRANNVQSYYGEDHPDSVNINGNIIPFRYGGGIYMSPNTNLILNQMNVSHNRSFLGGAGISVNTAGFLTIHHSIISENTGGTVAGISAGDDASLIMSYSIITNNNAYLIGSAGWGGGIGTSHSSYLELNHVSIGHNTASGGGGICIYSDTSILTNVSITNNSAGWGGGIIITGTANFVPHHHVWTNILIADNIGNWFGQPDLIHGGEGIRYNIQDAKRSIPVVITNATIVNNSGGGIHISISDPCPLLIRNSIIKWNKFFNGSYVNIDVYVGMQVGKNPVLYSNCLAGGINEQGVFDADPLFVDTAAKDYHLQCGSPAVNMGNNAFFHSDSIPNISSIVTDLDANPRFFLNGRVDLGTYELQDPCKPFIVLPKAETICYGDSIDIPIWLGGTAPWILVYTTNGQSRDTLKNIIDNPYIWRISPQDTTLYTFIYLENVLGDTVLSDSLIVTVIPLPKLTTILNNDSLCSGEQTKSVVFSGDATIYFWKASGDIPDSIPNYLSRGNFGRYTVINNGTTDLQTIITVTPLKVVGTKQCYGMPDSFQIVTFASVQIEGCLNDSLFCEGDSIIFDVLNKDLLTDIQWRGANGFSSSIANPVIYPSILAHTGSYVVEAKSISNCPVFPDTLELVVFPKVEITLEDTLILCNGESKIIEAHVFNADKYYWNTGDTTLKISLSSSGMYWMEVNNETCNARDTIWVIEIDLSNLQIETAGDFCIDGSMELLANIEDMNYQWSTGDTTPFVRVFAEGRYGLMVFTGDCKAENWIEIVCPCSLSLPNVFTPNEDGYNDEYIPEISSVLHTFSMIIYNRWGKIMYQTDTFTPWDGTTGGRKAVEGVYYCVVSYSCKDSPDKKRTAQSSVTLMR
jgi:gliding motility-associated-like protein